MYFTYNRTIKEINLLGIKYFKMLIINIALCFDGFSMSVNDNKNYNLKLNAIKLF